MFEYQQFRHFALIALASIYPTRQGSAIGEHDPDLERVGQCSGSVHGTLMGMNLGMMITKATTCTSLVSDPFGCFFEILFHETIEWFFCKHIFHLDITNTALNVKMLSAT